MSLNTLADNVLTHIKENYPFIIWVVDDHPYNRIIPMCKQHSALLIRQKSTEFCISSIDDYFKKYELKSNKCYFITVYFGKLITETYTTNIIRTVLYESLHDANGVDEKTIVSEFINSKYLETKYHIAKSDNDDGKTNDEFVD